MGKLESFGWMHKTCGGGTRKCTRKEKVKAKDGGIPCIGSTAGSALCNTQTYKSNEFAIL